MELQKAEQQESTPVLCLTDTNTSAWNFKWFSQHCITKRENDRNETVCFIAIGIIHHKTIHLCVHSTPMNANRWRKKAPT